jgi:hypothetical protein
VSVGDRLIRRTDTVVCREKADRLLFPFEPSGETLGLEFRAGLDRLQLFFSDTIRDLIRDCRPAGDNRRSDEQRDGQ